MITPDRLAQARALVADTLVWDNHACMPLRPSDESFMPQLADVKAGGVDVISLNIGFGPQSPEAHLAMLDSFTRWIEARPDDYLLVRRPTDVDAARASGRLGVFFDVEGMYPLNHGRIDLVETFRRGGVGWMLIAYNEPNDVGGGCTRPDGGLTPYGREVLAEMKRVGMIVCCSHTGHRTALDVMDAADNPVIFSHSNALAVHDHYRNIPDSLIKACAATGGVIGINGLNQFLGGGDDWPARIAEHVDHVAQLVGSDHVALGLDHVFDLQELNDYLETMKSTFPDADALALIRTTHPNRIVEVAAHLLDRGYTSDDIAAILGTNWLRIASRVWH